MKKKKKVLFLCTGNSSRSQMAEGLMNRFRATEYESFSAGTQPKGIHPAAIKVMKEIGIDISSHKSNHLNEFSDVAFDLIITVCDHAAQSCPVFLGNGQRIHHGFIDPAAVTGNNEEVLETFRKVRDQIKEFLQSV